MGAVNLGTPGAEDLVDRPLDHARKSQGGLGAQLPVFSRAARLFVDRQTGSGPSRNSSSFARTARRLAAALSDDLGGLLVVEQGQQQVLDARELVPPARGILQRPPNRLFQLRA
jgi:hypothetical protein